MGLHLHGSEFDVIDVIEVTPTGMLMEAPTQPELPVGHRAQLELDGRRGDATVTAFHGIRNGRAHYSVGIVELDEGLIEAIGAASRSRRRSKMEVRHDPTDG